MSLTPNKQNYKCSFVWELWCVRNFSFFCPLLYWQQLVIQRELTEDRAGIEPRQCHCGSWAKEVCVRPEFIDWAWINIPWWKNPRPVSCGLLIRNACQQQPHFSWSRRELHFKMKSTVLKISLKGFGELEGQIPSESIAFYIMTSFSIDRPLRSSLLEKLLLRVPCTRYIFVTDRFGEKNSDLS